VFLRRSRGMLDFFLALLCLWAAWYHTPVGALVRGIGARITGVHTSAGPLLSYFTGGAYEPPPALAEHPPPLPSGLAASQPLSPVDALGYGTYAVLAQLSAEERKPAEALATRYAIPASELFDSHSGPRATARLLRAAERDLGSDEIAVTALFVGEEPARYARDRLRAARDPLELANAARELPPGFDAAVVHASNALTLSTAYGLSWPLEGNAPVTSPFGARVDPVTNRQQVHTGVDLAVPVGTPVHSAAAGVVRRANEDSVCGRTVIIDHGRGVSTAYCHNSELLVTVGQTVNRGDLISRSGSTGRSTGPHLHYQLLLLDKPVDPFLFRAKGATVAATRVSAPLDEGHP
jgi:murein DD-endopeptidase